MKAGTSFTAFSAHYAEALDAMAAIERQAATIIGYGGGDDLRRIIDQFVAMCATTRDAARSANELDFAEWFEELLQKGEAIRAAIPL